MKNLLIGIALLGVIFSCDSTKKEGTAKTEKVTKPSEKVSIESNFFYAYPFISPSQFHL